MQFSPVEMYRRASVVEIRYFQSNVSLLIVLRFKANLWLLNKGSFNGVSVLGKKTVESMMGNQTGFLGDGRKSNNLSEAYGYGGSVKIDTAYEKT